jgi:peptidoglycan/xylan/chitin deacetylase (PgdA/CDA1 family)
MAWLRRWHRVLSLDAYLRYRREHRLPPARSVVVTIDDGYRDVRTVAYPILRRLGIPATIFLVSGALGGANAWDRSGELAGRPVLSREDARVMRTGGIAYGAHTRTHPHLPALPSERLRDEVVDGRRELEQAIGEPVPVFAYPYGERDARCEAIVAEAGFSAACGTESGPNSPATPPYRLRRTEVRGTDSLLRFALTLWLGDVPRLFDRAGPACRGGA